MNSFWSGFWHLFTVVVTCLSICTCITRNYSSKCRLLRLTELHAIMDELLGRLKDIGNLVGHCEKWVVEERTGGYVK